MEHLRVLVTSPPFLKVVDEYEYEFRDRGIDLVLRHPKQFFPENEMKELIRDFDGILCGDDKITRDVLMNANKLKVISKWGVGIDSIDNRAAAKLGIPVCNSPGAFSDACADVAIGYLIMLARSLHKTHALTMRGRWEKIPGMLLRGRTAGIIGVGNIGCEIARRATAFGLNVIGNDMKRISERFLVETGMQMCSRDDLLAQSDFIFVACDLNPTSQHLINAEAFTMMKNTSYLINVARGQIVDGRALVEALREEMIAGAALDVFEDEPLQPDSPLRLFDNCILGAHNAFHADGAVRFVHRNTVDNLLKHLCCAEADFVEEALHEVFRKPVLASSGADHVV